MLTDIGRFRELPKWRKDFKAEWKKVMNTPITMPLNKKYQPNVKKFVCTCPHFVVSRFLLCKHLVQLFHLVNPRFFLEVTRNRSLPFWSHLSLKPLATAEEGTEPEETVAITGDGGGAAYDCLNTARYHLEGLNPESDDDDDDGLVDMEGRGGDTVTEKKTYKEKMENYIYLIRDFCDGLEYQIKFQDQRFLRTLEKDGTGFMKLAQNCCSRERRQNLSRAASLSTWEKATSNAMFYRAWPSRNHDT